MKQNWVLIGALLSVLAIPFGLALFEDATRELPAEASPEPARAAPDPDPALEAEADSDTVVEWERAGPVDLGFLDEHLSDHEPGLAGDLARVVRFGEPASDETRRLEARVNAERGPDVTLAIEPAPNLAITGPVTAVRFTLPAEPATITALRGRWGPPTGAREGCVYWAGRELRAVLPMGSGPWPLQLSPYRRLDELFAPGLNGALGFEPTPLIGASLESIRERHGDRLAGDDTLLVTPAAASRAPSLAITLFASGGVVNEISAAVDLSCDSIAAREARRILESSLGPVAETARIGDAEELRFRDRPDVSAFVYPDRVVVLRRQR